MNISRLFFCAALAASGIAVAQDSTSVQGNAATRSSTSASANRNGAAASHESAASGAGSSPHAAVGGAQGTEMTPRCRGPSMRAMRSPVKR